jgi:hypothetical protein
MFKQVCCCFDLNQVLLCVMLSQAFYNPHIITVVDQLISPTEHASVSGWGLISSLCLNRGIQAVKGSAMYQIPIPKEFVGKTYGELFHHFVSKGTLCMGLYRGANSTSHNRLPYVSTNPDKKTIVKKNDVAFVLSQKEVLITENDEKVSLLPLVPFTTCI